MAQIPQHSGYQVLYGTSAGSNAHLVDTWIEYSIGEQYNIVGRVGRIITVYFYGALKDGNTTSTSHQNSLNTTFSVNGIDGETVSNGACDYRTSDTVNLYGWAEVEIRCDATGGIVDVPVVGTAATHSSYISGGSINTTIPVSFTSVTYTISYNADGGSPTPSSQTKTHGTNITLASAPSKSYDVITTFDANGGSVNPTTVKSTAYYPFSGWKANNGTVYGAGDTYTANESTTMTAQWGAAIGGAITFPTPERDGYTFDGWHYNGSPYTNHNPTTSKTLIAKWNPNTYVVTYDANGGTDAPKPQSFVYNSGEHISTAIPVRTGYEFLYWTTPWRDEPFYPGDAIPANWMDFGLVAQWKPKAEMLAKDDDHYRRGLAKVKHDGKWREGTTIYKKINGHWKAKN